MGSFYANAILPERLRRDFDVYDRIATLKLDLGTFDAWMKDLKGAVICSVVFHESGLTYLSGYGHGPGQMYDDPERIQEGQEAAQFIADSMIGRLHWALVCGGEGGDLNDVLYTVKGLGMVVSTDVAFRSAPAVMNGFSKRWHSVFGGGAGAFAVDGEDSSYAGVHARSAIGGFTGRFSIEPELIVALPPDLARAIIRNRGWLFPLPPQEAARIRAEYQAAHG